MTSCTVFAKPLIPEMEWLETGFHFQNKSDKATRPRTTPMRLTPAQIDTINSTAKAVLGEGAQVTLFGSRVDDTAKGGDVDLMIEVTEALADPAVVAARIASKVSRAMNGRKVDVLLKAPNLLEQPIHRIAVQQGVAL